MLQRIKEVVAIANNPATDATTKKQAIDYLEQAKLDPNASETFTALLTDVESDHLLRFVALQALSDVVIHIGAANSDGMLERIKATMLDVLRSKITSEDVQDPEFYKNKISEVFTRLFYYMYGDINNNRWPAFFHDLISVLSIQSLLDEPSAANFSHVGLDYLVRISISINSEIADQTFLRSKELQARNNSLKDNMRLQDINSLVAIWINALKSLAGAQNSSLASMILSCIGGYISWIDVGLIVNTECINAIYSYLDFEDTKIACCQCLCEIISKKMKPDDKLALLNLLNVTDKAGSLSDDEDVEVHEQIAKLVSSIGLELAIIMEQCNDCDANGKSDLSVASSFSEIANFADQKILTQVAPLVLRFLRHEYDSVTEQCFPFLSQYFTVLKKLFAVGGKPGSAVVMNSKKLPLDLIHQDFLESFLRVCFEKMKIDDSDTKNLDDSIEEFHDTVRSKLKVFQDNVAVINPAIYLGNISNCIQTLLSAPLSDWKNLELAIYQIHNLSESIRNNLFGLNKTEISSSQAAVMVGQFMHTLLQNSAIFQLDNPYIQISFFELVVRHYQFLGTSEKDILVLLNIFCSDFGLFNKREKVRLRTWYLFTRFIKTTKPKLTITMVSELIRKLLPVLSIKAIASASSNGAEKVDSIFDSQLYLFEGIGLLIGANSEKNYDVLDEVLAPLFTELETCISTQSHAPEFVLQSHHVLMAVGTLVRGVHMGLVPDNQVNNTLVSAKFIHRSLIEKFSNIAEVILVTFSYFSRHENIRDASRFTFSRLIPILNSGILPYANKLIALFLDSDLQTIEMNDFLSFLGQMVHTFHKDENCYQLFNNLLTPVINKVHVLMDEIDSENTLVLQQQQHGVYVHGQEPGANGKNVVITDTFRDKILVKKSYYNFLQTFVTNSVTSLLLTERNRAILPTILKDLLEYTPQEIQETSTMKLALNVLINFIRCFGSGKDTDANDTHAASTTPEKLDGLNEFFITRSIPLAFEIPFKPDYKFNVKDGCYRVAAIDLSRVLREIYMQSEGGANADSNPCLKYLLEVYFPQIQFPSELAMEFVQMLVTSDQKSFEKYYIALIERFSQQ